MSDWLISPKWGLGGSAGPGGATVGKYLAKSDGDEFNLYFGGLGPSVSIGVRKITDKLKGGAGGLSTPDFPAIGSPMYFSRFHYAKVSDGYTAGQAARIMSTGPGLIVEGSALLGGGASMQLLIFGFRQTFNPIAAVQAIAECLAYTYVGEFQSSVMDAFGIVGGVGVGAGASVGVTAYLGAWV
jgi:hypothetical protein